MKIKRIIAREWLILLVCLFIGTGSYILDDYLSWKKKLDRREIISKEKLDREPYKYNYTGIPKKKGKTIFDLGRLKRGYKFGEGYSEHGYLLLLPYLLYLFIRSIVWSIKQLREKL